MPKSIQQIHSRVGAGNLVIFITAAMPPLWMGPWSPQRHPTLGHGKAAGPCAAQGFACDGAERQFDWLTLRTLNLAALYPGLLGPSSRDVWRPPVIAQQPDWTPPASPCEKWGRARTLRKASREPFSMYSVTIIARRPGEGDSEAVALGEIRTADQGPQKHVAHHELPGAAPVLRAPGGLGFLALGPLLD